MAKKESTALAIPSLNALTTLTPESLPPLATGLSGRMLTSIGKDEPIEILKIINQQSVGNANAKDFINLDLNVRHITMYERDFADEETGEVGTQVCTVLTLDDGRLIDVRSEGLRRSIYPLLQAGMCPPYKPPLPCKIRSIPCGPNGERSRFALELDLAKILGGQK